jgi:hypothetical protein
MTAQARLRGPLQREALFRKTGADGAVSFCAWLRASRLRASRRDMSSWLGPNGEDEGF